MYFKWSGTEIEFNGVNHLLIKEDEIIGDLDTDDIKDLKPLNDRVLIKVLEAEQKTAGGLLLTKSAKEKPSIGNSVLYSKFAGNEFKSGDGYEYVILRA